MIRFSPCLSACPSFKGVPKRKNTQMKKSIKQICQLLSATVVFMLLTLGAWAQTVVTGKVTDSKDGLGVQGVTVSVKGTQVSTQTTADGSYRITVPSGSKSLVFTSVGYSRQEQQVNGPSVDVSFVATSQALNEVVVVGYGNVRRKDLTGAVTTIQSKDFIKGAITTPEQLIQGKVAGVSISTNGGAPGAGSTIRIRGGASLNASNDPLIIIDGVQLAGGGIAGSANALALINPNDIESFNILKDASAAAIYGSRGTNGVVIITTKKGKSGKPKFNFNSQLQVATVFRQADVMSAAEFRRYIDSNGTNDQKALMGTANTNWQDEVFQTAIGTDNNLSVTGSVNKGKLNMPYRVSAGYLNQNGILTTGNLQRLSASFAASPKFFNDHLKVDLNIKATNSRTRFANEGAIGAAATFDPTQPVRSGSARFGGYTEWLDAGSISGLRGLAPRNPVGLLEQTDDRSNVNRSIGNIQLDYKFHFLPELRFNANIGYDVARGKGTRFVNDSAAQAYQRGLDTNGVLKGGNNQPYLQKVNNTFAEFYLNYAKDIKALKSRVDFTAGYGYYDNKTTNFFYRDFFADGSPRVNTEPQFPFDIPQNRLVSVYGRLVYTLNNKYIVTLNGRRDGSSRLAPANRFLNYGSAAFAWKVKEENFLRESKVISDLKFRASYGLTGQQDGIGFYDYIPRYGLGGLSSQYQFGNNFNTVFLPFGYNESLTWEKTATTNFAVDFGLWENRVTGTVDFYLRETRDLLNVIDIPAGTNFTNRILANVGDLENRGVEFTLNTAVIRKKDMSLNLGFNATYNQNKITRLTLNDDDPTNPGQLTGGISGALSQTVQINSVGFNRNAFYVFQQVYGADGRPIDGVFVDRNGDGTINDRDLYRYKRIDPLWFMGFTGDFSYKQFSASFVLRSHIGNYVYNNVASNTGVERSVINPLGFLANGHRDVLNSNFSGNGDRYLRSDYYIQNASFLRMDNITLGYDLGKVFNNKANLRVTANVQNVFVITKYKGVDPEIGGGIDNNFYPRPRTYVLGVNLDF